MKIGSETIFHIAGELAARRRGAGLSRDALEKAVSLPKGMLEVYERATREIPAGDLWRIADRLELRVSAFLPAADPIVSPLPAGAVEGLIAAFRGVQDARARHALVATAEALAQFSRSSDR